jgi:hypothetical protein
MQRIRQFAALAAGAIIGAAGAVVGLGMGQDQPSTPPREPRPPEPYQDPDKIKDKNVDKSDKHKEHGHDSMTKAGKLDSSDVDRIVQDWPGESKKAANTIIEKYGAPHGATAQLLLWENVGPWKKVCVYGEEVDHQFPMPHKDVLSCTIDMKVPADKFDDLAQFDGSVFCFRTPGEIAAMCDKEEMNFLALNLAHDIIQGSKTVEEARDAYAKTAMAFQQGTKDPLTQELQFEVPTANTADPDRQHRTTGSEMTPQRPTGNP